MVKHIILWTLNPELSEEEKAKVKAGIKEGLEGLVGKVPGLIDVKVHVDGRLASSNADVMLDSTLESEEALKGYAVHPASATNTTSTTMPQQGSTASRQAPITSSRHVRAARHRPDTSSRTPCSAKATCHRCSTLNHQTATSPRWAVQKPCSATSGRGCRRWRSTVV